MLLFIKKWKKIEDEISYVTNFWRELKDNWNLNKP